MTVKTAIENDSLPPQIPGVKVNQIFGGGEMAERTRTLDWASTPVGPIERWSAALLTTVNTLLASRHPMFLWWGEELVQFYNDGYRPSLGEDKHPAALGQRGKECWPEIWPIIGPQIEAAMKSGESSWHENQLVPILRNGKLEDVYWTYGYSPVRDLDGQVQGTLVVTTETTGSVLAKRELQQERRRLADLFQQAPAFFASMRGADHVFDMVNPPYQELIGQREILGKSVREAVPEAEGQGFIEILDGVYRTGKPFIGRNTPIKLARTGSQSLEMRYLDFVYQPRRDQNGTVSGIIVLGVDVTDSKRAAQVLLQTEKLAAVGRLASSIAHEINNPLEAMTNLLYLAQQAAADPLTKEYVMAAEAELRRISVIANQTLRFHRQSTHQRLVTLDELIEGTLSTYLSRISTSMVRVERRERAKRPIMCFDGEIRQVLSNLIGNAIDATKSKGGRLLIRSREGTDRKSGRRGVFLTVADTGSGMSADSLAKIFEPFFTTKGIGGTGLGLWVSREIVGRHHGYIAVKSRQATDKSGTTFVVFLPCDSAARGETA